MELVAQWSFSRGLRRFARAVVFFTRALAENDPSSFNGGARKGRREWRRAEEAGLRIVHAGEALS